METVSACVIVQDEGRLLPAVPPGAEAAMGPCGLDALTASVFPMKVYEYLAASGPARTFARSYEASIPS